MKSDKIYILGILFITAVIFAILNYFTPLLQDDFALLFKYGPRGIVRPTELRVKNIADIFESQYYFYQTVNGRFFTHFLVQLMLLLGKNIFNLFNLIVFLSLMLLICNYATKIVRHKKHVLLFLFVIFSVWFFSPFFGQTMLWETGSVNYLWSCCLVVLYLCCFRTEEHNDVAASWLKLFLYFMASFLIGNTNESVTFGVAAAMFIYSIFNFRTLKPILWVMIIGFGLGVLAIIFSPGTIDRANHEMSSSSSLLILIKTKVLEFVGIVYRLWIPLTVCVLLIVLLKIKKVPVLKIFRREKTIILSFLFNGILLLIIGNVEDRMLFGLNVLLLLFTSVLLAECIKFFSSSTVAVISVLLSSSLLLSFYHSVVQVSDYNNKSTYFYNQFKNENQKVFYFPTFNHSRFVYHTIGGISDSKNYHNRVRSFYYGVKEINILPEGLYHDIYDNSLLQNGNNWSNVWQNKVQWVEHNKYVIIKLPSPLKYKESIFATFTFSNRKEKTFSAFVIPIMNKNYAFVPINKEDAEDVHSLTIVTLSGNMVVEIEKN